MGALAVSTHVHATRLIKDATIVRRNTSCQAYSQRMMGMRMVHVVAAVAPTAECVTKIQGGCQPTSLLHWDSGVHNSLHAPPFVAWACSTALLQSATPSSLVVNAVSLNACRTLEAT
jgi:hypothetical protein